MNIETVTKQPRSRKEQLNYWRILLSPKSRHRSWTLFSLLTILNPNIKQVTDSNIKGSYETLIFKNMTIYTETKEDLRGSEPILPEE